MSRRANGEFRCDQCRMHQSLCMCALIPRVDTRTRLVLVIHRAEARKTTNTGRLATMCLSNSVSVVRGHQGHASEPIGIAEGSRGVLLFPADNAVPLAALAASIAEEGRSVTLIVPDGNWRQASKVRARVPGLKDLPCAVLPSAGPSIYRLRHEAHGHGLATIEAIARAMGILEGPGVEAALERPFRAMVERTLWARGAIGAEAVTGGIPSGAMRHDPRGKAPPEL